MTAVTPKQPTGRTVQTYLNTGTFAAKVWTALGPIDAEKFKCGEKSYFETASRTNRRKRRAEGKSSRATLEFTYDVVIGIADATWAALKAAAVAGAAPKELAIADDDITLTGTTYKRGFFSVTITSKDRPTDGFIRYGLKFTEVEHYETVNAVVTRQVLTEVTV